MLQLFFVLLILSILAYKFLQSQKGTFLYLFIIVCTLAFPIYMLFLFSKNEYEYCQNNEQKTIQIINKSSKTLQVYLLDSHVFSSIAKVNIGAIRNNHYRNFYYSKNEATEKIVIAKDSLGKIKCADLIDLEQKSYTILSTDSLPNRTLKVLNKELDYQKQEEVKHSILVSLLCLLWVINIFLIYKKPK